MRVLLAAVLSLGGLLLCAPARADGADGATGWIKGYGGSFGDVFTSVAATPDGGFVAVGSSSSADGDLTADGNRGGADLTIAKFDEEGNKVWFRSYGGSGDEVLGSVACVPDGGFVAVGSSDSADGDFAGHPGGAFVARFDADGEKVWIKDCEGGGATILSSVIAAPGGGFVAVGQTPQAPLAPQGGSDFAVARFDADGEKVWFKTYGGSGFDEFYSVAEAPDGGFVAVGSSESSDGDLSASPNKGYNDLVIAKFDAGGNKAWLKAYGGSGWGWFASVAAAPGGGFVAVGQSSSADGDLPGNRGDSDFVVAGFGADGSKAWFRNYGGSSRDALTAVVPAPGGGFVSVGWSWSADGDLPGNKGVYEDAVIARFDAQGLLSPESGPSSCAVTLDANGGTVGGGASTLERRPYGSAVGALPALARTGHAFAGWFTAPSGGTRVTEATVVTGDVTYYAHWMVNTYTVVFRGWDGKAIGAAQRVAHGAGAVAPKAPARTGHTFAGWDKAFTGVTSDLTVTARYTANSYTIRLDANGGKVGGKASASVKRTYGQALGSLAKPARTGYTFLGWYTGKAKGTKVGATTKVTENVTYCAHWRANGPVVTLNANGGKVGGAATATVVKAKGAAVGRLATPTLTGYAFQGWFTGKAKGTKVTAKARVVKNVTYWAHWAKVHTVKLDAACGKVGGKASSSLKKIHSSKLGKLATPKRTGYQFLGWYTAKYGGKKVTAGTKVTKAVTLYAHWKRAR
jgi:uncharacterized repeat protein (TIGR02543 family)